MKQVTASEFRANLGKYLVLAEREDIVISRSGKKIARLSGIKQQKVVDIESLFGIISQGDDDLDIKNLKAERLTQKYASPN